MQTTLFDVGRAQLPPRVLTLLQVSTKLARYEGFCSHASRQVFRPDTYARKRRRNCCGPNSPSLPTVERFPKSTAFITLDDISDRLPSYEESVLTVGMDPDLAKAYEEIEKDITFAMKEHPGNKSLMSVMLNTLLLYPDHPFGIEEIWGKLFSNTSMLSVCLIHCRRAISFTGAISYNLARRADGIAAVGLHFG